MSATTTLKLPETLKARVNESAAHAGQSPHAFMVEAIERQTQLAEQRREFVATAISAEQEVADYGLIHEGDDVLADLKAKLERRKANRPRKTKL